MNFDDFLNDLNADIERSLNDIRGDINNIYGTNNDNSNNSNNDTSDEEEVIFCPECGTKNPADSMFCSECGTNLHAYEDEDEDYSDDMDDDDEDEDYEEEEYADDEESDSKSSEKYNGVLMTDTVILAKKYSDSRDKIRKTLQDFIKESEKFGKRWAFFDLGDVLPSKEKEEWLRHSKALDDFMNENDIKPSPRLSLFIIGGPDVVPQPTSDNPTGGSDEYDSTIFSDFFYSFSDELSLDFLDYSKARCNVGRLPLEKGKMSTKFSNDIEDYLNRSIETMEEGGIKIGKAVMTSNKDWIPASREMSRNLPMPHYENIEGETLDNMFISPDILVGMDDDLADTYYEAIDDADMLVFNLHGASSPEQSGFYSNDLAFSIHTLNHTNAPIFNTVACWGARYIRYNREESMLLNALYNHGVLLYSGACVPALGKCGNFRYDGTWRIQPAAYSETFMARYCEYLCLGKLNAGEAFLKAKCDYYNSSRMVEDDECILGTVLMFNLYGNPAIRTRPDIETLREIQEESGLKVSKKRIPFRKMNKTVLMKKSKSGAPMSLRDMVTMAVDNNLRAIHEDITRSLYNNLGLEPRELSLVERFTTQDHSGREVSGYIYNYDKERGQITSRVMAKTDNEGNILSVIETK